jgi:beta-lactamase superfamily II metal-dependent hydrolase
MMRRISIAVLATAVLVAIAYAAQSGNGLDIYWIDVEGGAATLIVTPAGESVLVDSGYPDERGAPRIHKVASGVAGLKRIDHLVVTHFHNDHFGGAAELAKLMPIGQVHDNGAPSPAPSGDDVALFDRYQKAFPQRALLKPGDTIALSARGKSLPSSLRLLGTRQTFVAPPPDRRANSACSALTTDPPDTSDNANSTAWLLEFGRFRFFEAGDLTWNAEAKLACPVDLVGPVDVYQVSHHGLGVSNNSVLLQTLAPTVAVMNNGARKGTEARTVATLKALPSLRASYQLHRNVRDDGQNSADAAHTANAAEQCEANYIQLRVSPDGGSYTVEIPATGHKQSFAVKGSG